MICRLPLTGAALLLLLLAALSGQPQEKAPAAAPIEFLVSTPARTVHVRLHVEVDGQQLHEAFRSAHKEQLRGLFTYLDRNGDGRLDEAEARGIPLPLFRLPGAPSADDVYLAYNFSALDVDGDARVMPEELAGFYEEFEGGPFESRPAPGSPFLGAGADLALFNLLDTDRDGKLSKAEVANSSGVLAKLDRTGDELVSLRDFAPQRGPQVVEGGPPIMPPPARSPVSLDPEKLKAFDGVAPDLELRIRLGERKADTPLLEVLRPTGKDALVSAVRKRDTELVLELDKVRVELRVDRTRLSARSLAGLREQATRAFRSADADGDGTVDRGEVRRSMFLRDVFGIIDRKGTGRVREADLREYCERVLVPQARTMGRRVSLVAAEGSLGVWDSLDRNRDLVLGVREVKNAPAVLAALDRNGDGFVELPEVPSVFALQVGCGQTDFRRLSGDDVVAFTADGRLTYTSGEQGGGPLWFRKMDRNGDGDVSRGEFLGPPEAFKRLDRDGDDIISREEAEQAGR